MMGQLHTLISGCGASNVASDLGHQCTMQNRRHGVWVIKCLPWRQGSGALLGIFRMGKTILPSTVEAQIKSYSKRFPLFTWKHSVNMNQVTGSPGGGVLLSFHYLKKEINR